MDSVNDIANQAIHAVTTGRNGAEKHLTKAGINQPEVLAMVDASKRVGDDCLKRQENAAALKHYQQAVGGFQLIPGLAKDHGNLLARIFSNVALAQTRQGNHEAALTAAQSALKSDPDFPSAKFRICRSLIELQRFDDYQDVINNLQHQFPDDRRTAELQDLHRLRRRREASSTDYSRFEIQENTAPSHQPVAQAKTTDDRTEKMMQMLQGENPSPSGPLMPKYKRLRLPIPSTHSSSSPEDISSPIGQALTFLLRARLIEFATTISSLIHFTTEQQEAFKMSIQSFFKGNLTTDISARVLISSLPFVRDTGPWSLDSIKDDINETEMRMDKVAIHHSGQMLLTDQNDDDVKNIRVVNPLKFGGTGTILLDDTEMKLITWPARIEFFLQPVFETDVSDTSSLDPNDDSDGSLLFNQLRNQLDRRARMTENHLPFHPRCSPEILANLTRFGDGAISVGCKIVGSDDDEFTHMFPSSVKHGLYIGYIVLYDSDNRIILTNRPPTWSASEIESDKAITHMKKDYEIVNTFGLSSFHDPCLIDLRSSSSQGAVKETQPHRIEYSTSAGFRVRPHTPESSNATLPLLIIPERDQVWWRAKVTLIVRNLIVDMIRVVGRDQRALLISEITALPELDMLLSLAVLKEANLLHKTTKASTHRLQLLLTRIRVDQRAWMRLILSENDHFRALSPELEQRQLLKLEVQKRWKSIHTEESTTPEDLLTKDDVISLRASFAGQISSQGFLEGELSQSTSRRINIFPGPGSRALSHMIPSTIKLIHPRMATIFPSADLHVKGSVGFNIETELWAVGMQMKDRNAERIADFWGRDGKGRIRHIQDVPPTGLGKAFECVTVPTHIHSWTNHEDPAEEAALCELKTKTNAPIDAIGLYRRMHLLSSPKEGASSPVLTLSSVPGLIDEDRNSANPVTFDGESVFIRPNLAHTTTTTSSMIPRFRVPSGGETIEFILQRSKQCMVGSPDAYCYEESIEVSAGDQNSQQTSRVRNEILQRLLEEPDDAQKALDWLLTSTNQLGGVAHLRYELAKDLIMYHQS